MTRAASRVAKEIAAHLASLEGSVYESANVEKATLQTWLLLLAPRSRKARVKATPAKVATKALDALCREVVFLRDGNKCRKCGKTTRLQWAHCYSRRYKWLRWDLDNSFCLCSGCHLEWHHKPLEAASWWAGELKERYRSLVLRASKPRKMDTKLAKLYLESQRRLYE